MQFVVKLLVLPTAGHGLGNASPYPRLLHMLPVCYCPCCGGGKAGRFGLLADRGCFLY